MSIQQQEIQKAIRKAVVDRCVPDDTSPTTTAERSQTDLHLRPSVVDSTETTRKLGAVSVVNFSPGSERYLRNSSNASLAPDDVATITPLNATNKETSPPSISDDPEGPLDTYHPSSTMNQPGVTSIVYPTSTSNNTTKVKRSFMFQWGKRRSVIALANRKLVFVVVLQSVLLLAAIIAVILLALPSSNGGNTSTSTTPGNTASISTLNAVRARGVLHCGVVEYPGLATFDETTSTWSGFEVDLCRAVGAAVFGNDSHVTFTALTNSGRFIALQSQQVDLLAAAATYTMERDLYEPSTKTGFTFSAPYLYNGLSFAGQPQFVNCADQRNITGNCSGIEICVQDGTTHVGIVKGLFPGSVIKLAPTMVDFYNNFVQGHCNVLAGEQFDLAEINVRQAGYSGYYIISNVLYSKEPLSLVTRDDDVEWSDFVNWVFLALLTAENQNITQQTAQDAIANPTATVKETPIWAYQAVAAVGNYGEMYDRHLQSLVPRATVNKQNNSTSPLMYSMPFGGVDTVGPGPIANGTLERILQRGELRCGVGTAGLFFANFKVTTQQWSGLNVFVCMAISAAIFNGTGSTQFIQVDPNARFSALANDDIDLLVRTIGVTYLRDVDEPSTNVGYTFAAPNYYGGLSFGGVPAYAECANRLDVSSSQCQGLLICVNNGTTNMINTQRLFPEKFIVVKSSQEEVYKCLQNGESNVIGTFATSTATVRQYYSGPYQPGSKLFSRDNFAPVTRQDDPQWSSFVNWIMHALFYAEEQGITQATYTEMPLVNLFGSAFSGMFQNAIQAVGSYGEIYSRSAGSDYPRTAINMLNVNPLGPQHYPPPGLFGLA